MNDDDDLGGGKRISPWNFLSAASLESLEKAGGSNQPADENREMAVHLIAQAYDSYALDFETRFDFLASAIRMGLKDPERQLGLALHQVAREALEKGRHPISLNEAITVQLKNMVTEKAAEYGAAIPEPVIASDGVSTNGTISLAEVRAKKARGEPLR